MSSIDSPFLAIMNDVAVTPSVQVVEWTDAGVVTLCLTFLVIAKLFSTAVALFYIAAVWNVKFFNFPFLI